MKSVLFLMSFGFLTAVFANEQRSCEKEDRCYSGSYCEDSVYSGSSEDESLSFSGSSDEAETFSGSSSEE